MVKRLITAFFILFIYKPIRALLKFLFYKAVVRFYSLYLSFLKRLGWKGFRGDLFSFLLSQKLVHVLVILITVLLIAINLTPRTRAGGFAERAHETILANLISSEFGDFEEDDQLIVETFDKESAITAAHQSYLDNLGSFRSQPQIKIGAVDEEEEMTTIQGGGSIVKPEIASTKKTKRARTGIVAYVVLPGDTISTIAEEFEISVSTVLWENDLSAYSIIRPGDKLAILPQSGITHKIAKGETLSSIAKKYKIEEEKMLQANKLANGAVLTIGNKLIIPGGKKVSYVSYKPASYTGFAAIRDAVKAPNASPAAGNKMNWPTAGKRITQYYSWRHHAVDIANKTGTPIYAADSGTIEYAGWGTGYGNQIVINHGGGKKTRYAHLSKFYVKKGNKVTKGQTIAAMGSTGWSTGPHVHFEVIINGVKYNPLNYIK